MTTRLDERLDKLDAERRRFQQIALGVVLRQGIDGLHVSLTVLLQRTSMMGKKAECRSDASALTKVTAERCRRPARFGDVGRSR